MANTPHLGLTLLEQAQAQKEVTVNTALMRIDALLNTAVADKDLSAPPSSPEPGALYIVASGAGGAWEGQEGKVAYHDQVWRFISPNQGLMLWVADEGIHYVYEGSGWGAAAISVGALSGLSDVALASPGHGQVLVYDGGSASWVNGTVSGSVGGGLSEGQALDAVGAALTDSATVQLTYNGTTPAISAVVKDASISTAKLGGDITAAGKALLDDASSAAQRTTLGLGSAAIQNTGSSGANIPLLNVANTWSATQTCNTSLFADISIGVGRTSSSAGTADAGVIFSASGYFIIARDGTNDQVHAIFTNNNDGTPATVGSIRTSGSSTTYSTSSDYRLKRDVRPVEDPAGRLLALHPVNFEWIVDGSRADGFLAHEVQAVVPNAVIGEKDAAEMQAIDHSRLVPLLVAALQDALQRIAALEGHHE